MEVQMIKLKMVPREFDLNCQIGGRSGDWAGTLVNSDMLLYKLAQRWKFYYPVDSNFRGSLDDLKLLTCPGEGYVPKKPWCTFDTDSTYELNMFLDLYPYI